MSPKDKKKLKKLRINLDKLDNLLISLIKKRTELVKEVLSLKKYKYQKYVKMYVSKDKLFKNCFILLLVDKKLGKIKIRTAIRNIADII